LKQIIKIGSRESKLAVWQARYIEDQLKAAGAETELVFIKSEGEMDLVSPLYEMGVQGIFTKALDIALLDGRIDIAVHSLKDVPTQLAKNISIAAVPERGNWKDLLVYKKVAGKPEAGIPFCVATSSLRRKAQWLHRFPDHTTDNLRGNINSRLQKLIDTDQWQGALFAAAGIERIGLEVPFKMELDWMLPAPAQGALAVLCRTNDQAMLEICGQLNHNDSRHCAEIERQFLRVLMGGCSLPIAGLAEIRNDKITVRGNVLTVDGKQKAEVECEYSREEGAVAGKLTAEKLLKNGGSEILHTLKSAGL
jgi:hydroxymethylbilane synthase